MPLVVAGLGVWYGISRRRWLTGAAIAAAGLAFALVAVDVIIPHFNPRGHSSFYGRYNAVGGTAAGIVRKAFTDPGRLLSVAFDHRGAHYLLDVLPKVAGWPARRIAELTPMAWAAAKAAG